MLTALNYLNYKQIIHRDIKPENFIFMDENNTILVLIDFGSAI